jgi:hypothetical protein
MKNNFILKKNNKDLDQYDYLEPNSLIALNEFIQYIQRNKNRKFKLDIYDFEIYVLAY